MKYASLGLVVLTCVSANLVASQHELRARRANQAAAPVQPPSPEFGRRISKKLDVTKLSPTKTESECCLYVGMASDIICISALTAELGYRISKEFVWDLVKIKES